MDDQPLIKWLPPENPAPADWLAWANALPLVRELGMRCTALDERSAVFELNSAPLVPNPNGAVNGGLVVTIADQVMGAIATRLSEPGMLPATGSLHTQFHRPALAPLVMRGNVLGGGRRVSFIEVVIEDKDGHRCATSQGTMVSGGSVRSPRED